MSESHLTWREGDTSRRATKSQTRCPAPTSEMAYKSYMQITITINTLLEINLLSASLIEFYFFSNASVEMIRLARTGLISAFTQAKQTSCLDSITK